MPPFHWNLILFGCLGGLFPDVLRVIKGRYQGPAPYYYYPTFWFGLALLVVVGGFCAWLCEAAGVKDALAYGFTAPELLAKMFSEKGPASDQAVDRGAGGFELRRWWKG